MPETEANSNPFAYGTPMLFRNFCRDTTGSTAVEYALMVGVLSGIMLASIQTLGKASSTSFEQVSQTFESVATARENAPQASTISAPVAISISPVRP